MPKRRYLTRLLLFIWCKALPWSFNWSTVGKNHIHSQLLIRYDCTHSYCCRINMSHMDTLSPVTYLQPAPTHEKSSTPMQRPKLRACSWRAMNKGTESLIHMGLGGTRNLCPAGAREERFGVHGLRGFSRFGVTLVCRKYTEWSAEWANLCWIYRSIWLSRSIITEN